MIPFNFDTWMGILMGLLKLTGKSYETSFPSGRPILWIVFRDSYARIRLSWDAEFRGYYVEREYGSWSGEVWDWGDGQIAVLETAEEVCSFLAAWHESPEGDWDTLKMASTDGGYTLEDLWSLANWDEVMNA